MEFFKKSIGRKLGGILFVLLILACAGIFVILNFELPIALMYGILALIMLMLFIAVRYMVTAPLNRVFHEMKALLTGKSYKKIFTDRIDEVGVLAHFFNDVTKNIEHISHQVEEGKRISEELSVASDIQKKVLPTTIPAVPGLTIFGKTRPATEVGGDSFDIIPTASKNTLIYIGDVTGHGLPAALIMVMVNMLVRALSDIHTSGYDIMINTNRILKQRIDQRRFMTCILLRWSGQENKMYYTGCGHEHILIYRKKGATCEVKQTGGIALGMVADVSKIIKEELIPLEPGDSVILYSDGIIEAKNMTGEMFGIDRLKKTVEQYASTATPEELFTNISKDFGVFVGEQVQADDITLIVVQRT